MKPSSSKSRLLRLVFAHGLQGSPHGRKVKALRGAGLRVKAPDFRGMDLAARIRLLEEATQGTVSVLAGSSYGGLAALVVAARHSARFSGLLLLAPALHLCEPPVHDPTAIAVPQGLRAVILHGRRDDVVPIEVSRRLAERSKGNVTLHEVDDDHRLADSLDLMVTAAEELLRP